MTKNMNENTEEEKMKQTKKNLNKNKNLNFQMGKRCATRRDSLNLLIINHCYKQKRNGKITRFQSYIKIQIKIIE